MNLSQAYKDTVSQTIIKRCQKHELYVNVLGNDIPEHRLLAMKTGGSWHAVPQDTDATDSTKTPPQRQRLSVTLYARMQQTCR